MNLPGFTAEASLAPTEVSYRSAPGTGGRKGFVVPQQLHVGQSWLWWFRCPPGCVPTGNPLRPCFCWSVFLW